jgi:hypothetical protein
MSTSNVAVKVNVRVKVNVQVKAIVKVMTHGSAFRLHPLTALPTPGGPT